MAIPRAKSKGLDLEVLATGLRSHNKKHSGDIWVRKDSPIRTADDLKGKKIGVYSLNSTGITLVRIALWKKYGHNVSFQGGDSEWVQVPAPSIPAALASDQIDAGTLIHAQAYKAMRSGDFRSVVAAAKPRWRCSRTTCRCSATWCTGASGRSSTRSRASAGPCWR